MKDLFGIGEFSRTTHLSVKALRHYHDVGLLEPVAVDPATGYRCYSVAQVPPAQVIRRLRDLDMPIEEVRAVLDASEDGNVEHRTVPATRVVTIAEPVGWDDAESWLSGAFDVLHRAVPAGARRGPDSALYSGESFEAHIGEVVACIAVDESVVAGDRVRLVEIPAATLAVTVHEGAFDELDRTYAALGSYVAGRAIGVDGPIRERYLVAEADDPAELRTEVGWPISTV